MTLVGAPSAAQLRVGGYAVALAMRILGNVAYTFYVGMVGSSICVRFAVFHCVIFEANKPVTSLQCLDGDKSCLFLRSRRKLDPCV